MTDLATDQGTAAPMIVVDSPFASYRLLDPRTGGVRLRTPRIDALATLSAGYKDASGLPVVSRHGAMFLHDPDNRAPALHTDLVKAHDDVRCPAVADHKNLPPHGHRLVIAFPFNDPEMFIQQRFTLYTRTAIQLYGDQRSLHEIITHPGPVDKRGRPTVVFDDHLIHEAGTARYRELVKLCNVSWSIYFMRAAWRGTTADLPFDDGYPGLYRLRTTSPYSIEKIMGTLEVVARRFDGQVAGIPFELSLAYDERTDQTGMKRSPPAFVIVVKPPESIHLSGGNYESVLAPALVHGLALQPGGARALPPPSTETWQAEVAVDAPPPSDEAIEADIDVMRSGDPPIRDRARWAYRWVSRVKGTVLDSDEARAGFMEAFTNGETKSLSAFLRSARQSDCVRLMEAVEQVLDVAAEDAHYDEMASTVGAVAVPSVDPDPPAADAPDVIVLPEGQVWALCEWCGEEGICSTDGAGEYECVDRDACYARLQVDDTDDPYFDSGEAEAILAADAESDSEITPVATPPTGEPPVDGEGVPYDKEQLRNPLTTAAKKPNDDTRGANAWLLSLNSRYRELRAEMAQTAPRAEQAKLGRALSKAAEGDMDVAAKVLLVLTGKATLAETTLAHTRVLLAEAGSSEWSSNIAMLYRAAQQAKS